MGEAVGVVLWAVRVLGVVRAVRGGGVGMHWQPLNILIFRKCKQSVRERWSGGGNSRGGTVGGEGAGARWAWACIGSL